MQSSLKFASDEQKSVLMNQNEMFGREADRKLFIFSALFAVSFRYFLFVFFSSSDLFMRAFQEPSCPPSGLHV